MHEIPDIAEISGIDIDGLQGVLDALPLAVVVIDTQSKVLSWNRAAESLFGWSRTEVLGRLVPAIPEERQAELAACLAAALRGERCVVDSERCRRDGSRLQLRMTTSPAGSVEGVVDRIVLTFEDSSGPLDVQSSTGPDEEGDRERRLYSTVLSHAPDLIYAFDLQHRFTYANATLLEMWGKTLEEAIGKTCLELGYEPWHAAMHDREIEQVITTGKPILGEVPFNGTQGRRVWEYIFVPIIGPDGSVEAIAGTARDVTERRLVEDSVRQSEHLLGQVFEAAPAFMAVLRGPQLIIEKANVAYRNLVGDGRDLIGRPLLEALPELAETSFPTTLVQVMESGESFQGKGIRVALQRSADAPLEDRWVDFIYEPLREADGRISGVMAQGIDLTERVVAENALRQSEQRLRFVMDSMPQKIFASTSGGLVDYLNPRWTEFTGLPVEQLQDWSGFIHPDDLEQNIRLWEHSVASGEPFVFQHRFLGADGAYRWHLTRAVAMKDEQGKVLTWIGASTDIHEQREAANQLRALAVELSEADRRKNEFIALLAHELRNPLAPIANALQIMRLADGRKESIDFAAAVMERQIVQLVRLVDDLLDVSRISRGKIELRREQLPLASAVAHAVEAARPLARSRDQSLTVSLPPDPLTLSADPTRLAQIIGNLLNNAVKFTPHGGSIRLHVERHGEEAMLCVSDTGIGIAPDQIGRIFEMFTQLDTSLERSVSGLGIGLSLVRTLVEMHGGTISARSAGPGQGSEFTVRLPLLAEPDASAGVDAAR